MKTKAPIPPPLARRLLTWFLRDDLAEEVQGDLEEKFYSTVKNRSNFGAKLNYWYQVLHYVRPFAIRKRKTKSSNHYDMFQNYFKIALRNLTHNKGYSFINIGGLAIGMAVALMIGLWIHDEVSYDTYHANYHRIARVMQHKTINDVTRTGNSIPRPLENVLRTTYGSDFRRLSMATWTSDHILTIGTLNLSKQGNYFQEDFPEMLSLKMIKGTRKGLNNPNSILLSESTAEALFDKSDPINQTIRVDNHSDVKVIGVYEDLPHNTSFGELQFMASWELFITQEPWIKESLTIWGNDAFQLLVEIAPNADMKSISERIKLVKAKNSEEEAQFHPEFFLAPMSDWHLRSEWKEGRNAGGRIQLVWLFGIIGAFVLLLACINFMNLSTARSEKRAKEVGIRMTIGSVRSQLINQFLSESLLVTTLSFILASGVVILSLPWFNDLADKRIFIAWGNPWFWGISFAFILVTSLVAGSYPALYLSSFQPVRVLKGTFKTGRFASLPRKVLVVFQFTVSITLIIGTIIVYQQIQFSKNRPIGYDRKGLVMIPMKSPDYSRKFDVLRTELKTSGAVEEMSASLSPITAVWMNSAGVSWQGKNPALQGDFAIFWITHEYGKTVGWKVKEGRDLSREFSTDSTAVLLNETAVKFMGIKDPVGVEIDWVGGKFHVIGVVEDMLMQSPYEPVKQAVYMLNYENVSWITLKLNPVKSASESIALVESVFKKNIPGAPFEYKFVDEEYGKKFDAEERIGKLSSVFAVLAILISCLGLFGLASFIAEQRTKEIGVRKVLGASVSNLWKMLSKDFVFLVIISCIIAIPASYYYLRNWLSQYEYRTEISWWVFVAAGTGALVITLLTVSYQAIKAALMNPVNSLRSE